MLPSDWLWFCVVSLVAGLPPYSPVFKSWLHCWNHLSHKVESLHHSHTHSAQSAETPHSPPHSAACSPEHLKPACHPPGSPLQRIQLLLPPGACDLPALHRGLTSSPSSSHAGVFFSFCCFPKPPPHVAGAQRHSSWSASGLFFTGAVQLRGVEGASLLNWIQFASC